MCAFINLFVKNGEQFIEFVADNICHLTALLFVEFPVESKFNYLILSIGFVIEISTLALAGNFFAVSAVGVT
jgi:hypothetical protein